MMSFEVRVAEITDHQRGALDLAKLFELSESHRSRTERPRKPVALALRPKVERALVLTGKAPLLPARQRRSTAASLAPAFTALALKKRKTSGRLPSAHEVQIGLVEGTGSQVSKQFFLRDAGTRKIRLPHFLDRHVTALVLKRMLGQEDDIMLKRIGVEWDIVPDNAVIDLADRSIDYRIGPVQMHS